MFSQSVVVQQICVCCVTQQTCLLGRTADMSAVSHRRHVCCVTQQTFLLCDTTDMSAAVKQHTFYEGKGRVLDMATEENVPYVNVYGVSCLFW